MNFVGKAIRQWGLVPREPAVWGVRTPEYSLVITRGDDLLYSWLLLGRLVPFNRSGVEASLHDAEVAASATAIAEKHSPRKGSCFICGASASNRKIIYGPVRGVLLCDTHLSVCRMHQQHPCLECDS